MIPNKKKIKHYMRKEYRCIVAFHLSKPRVLSSLRSGHTLVSFDNTKMNKYTQFDPNIPCGSEFQCMSIFTN